MIRHRLIEAQTGKPPVRQIHTDFVKQSPFARDAVKIPDQQNAQQDFPIDRRPADLTVQRTQLLADRSKIDVTINGAQQMIRGNPIIKTEILEHRGRL